MDTISDPRSCVEGISSVTKKRMGIFRAVGLGLVIVILKLLMPGVMSGLEGSLSAFFGITETLLVNAQSNLN